MISQTRITKNAGWLFASNIISNVIGFVLLVLIARFLGDEKLGLYSFAFAFASIVALVFDLGLLFAPLKEIARDKSKTKEYYWNAATIKFFASIVALLLPILSVWILGASALTIKIVTIASVAMAFNYFSMIFKMLFTAYEMMKYDAVAMMIERIVALIIGVFVLILGGDIVQYTLVLLFSYFVYFFLLYRLSSKLIVRLSFKFDFKIWKKLWKLGFPFWFTFIFLKIYFQIDTVMLSALRNFTVTGWYNAAYTLINGLSFIPYVISTALFPAFTILYKKNKIHLKSLYTRAINYLFIIGFPIAMGTLLLADRIILSLYQETFINAIPALQVLIWAELLLFLNHNMGYLLNAIDKQKLFTITTGIAVVVNVLLNFILIPRFSYIGAAVATVATELVVFLLLYFFTTRAGYPLKWTPIIAKPVLAGTVMGILVYFFSWVHVLIIIPVACLVYFSLLILMKAVGKEEMQLVKVMLSKKRKE